MEHCLVGRVLTRKQVHLESFERTMVSAWGLVKGITIQKMGEDRFVIRFEHVAEKKRIMWRSPWAFDRNLVILREIKNNEDPMEVNLNLCDFYIQVSGLPTINVTRAFAKAVGDAIGIFVDVDEEDSQRILATSMRLRVCIDVNKPLMRCLTIEGPRTNAIQLRLVYEKLPNSCYFCGVMGHLVKDCNECLHLVKDSDKIDDKQLEYGDWTKSWKVNGY